MEEKQYSREELLAMLEEMPEDQLDKLGKKIEKAEARKKREALLEEFNPYKERLDTAKVAKEVYLENVPEFAEVKELMAQVKVKKEVIEAAQNAPEFEAIKKELEEAKEAIKTFKEEHPDFRATGGLGGPKAKSPREKLVLTNPETGESEEWDSLNKAYRKYSDKDYGVNKEAGLRFFKKKGFEPELIPVEDKNEGEEDN